MKIVKFRDGSYGLRKWVFNLFEFGYVFADLNSYGFWWNVNSRHFPNCKGTLDSVKSMVYKIKNNTNDEGEVVE